MPTNSTIQPAGNRALAQRIYNEIMAKIEPDLLLENIPLLDAKYVGETDEQHAVRMERYAAAYKQYDEDMKVFTAHLNASVRDGKRKALKSKEEAAKRSDQDTLNSLASAFA